MKKHPNTDDDRSKADNIFDLLIIVLIVALLIFAMGSCTPYRPGYKKTPSGWNTKEQKKRIKKHKKANREYQYTRGLWRTDHHVEYFGGVGVPVTNIYQKYQKQ